MKEKSEAFEIFKNFKAFVENESGCTIQCLRTDRVESIHQMSSMSFVILMVSKGN
jgi:hypothetical protein